MNFCFWRKIFPLPETAVDDGNGQLDWEMSMLNRGFRHWMDQRPPHGIVVELYRREWPTGYVMDRDDVRPETNVYGLWWRIPGDLVIDGIAAEQSCLEAN